MTQLPPASRPLELTPPFWVALLLVGLIGLYQVVRPPRQSQALGYLEEGNPIILRQRGKVHPFPTLGVTVGVFDGWTYLSIAEDSEALAPTFVHPGSNSIVRLQPFHLQTWPPQGLAVEREDVGDFDVEWVVVDDLHLGRLSRQAVDLAILVMSHQPNAPLDPAIREFCRRIHRLDENAP